jgi:hypothetical protein
LDQSSKSDGEIVSFINYAVRGFVDGLREQLETIWKQQLDVFWRDLVQEKFRGRNNPAENSNAATRQRHLALDLGDNTGWVEVGKTSELSIRLAAAYTGKTAKTVQRDVSALFEMGLIQRDGRKIRARRELILSFLPLRSEK